MRRAARRDANERPLVDLAESLGWWMVKLDQPCDWIGCRRGVWFPIELKSPEREGHADEFTAAQVVFHGDARARRAPVLVWRTAEDVMQASGVHQ